jgi:hypothetical protein
MCHVNSPSLDSIEAGAPEAEIKITPEMIEAGAEVVCRCFDDPTGRSYGEHVAGEVYRAMRRLDRR